MKVLVVGSGGREHVICYKLKQTGKVDELFCCPGNGGIASIATCVDIKATEVDKITEYAVENKFDLVVVAPEDPLALGLVDKLNEKGIRAFGPSVITTRPNPITVHRTILIKLARIASRIPFV